MGSILPSCNRAGQQGKVVVWAGLQMRLDVKRMVQRSARSRWCYILSLLQGGGSLGSAVCHKEHAGVRSVASWQSRIQRPIIGGRRCPCCHWCHLPSLPLLVIVARLLQQEDGCATVQSRAGVQLSHLSLSNSGCHAVLLPLAPPAAR